MQNLNLLAHQRRVVALDLGVAEEGVLVLVVIIRHAVENQVFIGNQLQVLLANGLVLGNRGSNGAVALNGLAISLVVRNLLHLGLGGLVLDNLAVLVLNGIHVQSIVDDLSSILTRQSSSQRSVNVVQQAVLFSQTQGLVSPSSTNQTFLVCLVASSYEQHLSSFNAGYVVVRAELGSGLTSNDAVSLAVLDVASSPVAGNVGESGGSRCVGICIAVTSTSNVDHFCHLRTGNGAVRLERAVFKAVDYAESSEHIHSFGSLNVSRIRERCTSKHGECASKRQYQCKNLFEIRVKISKLWYNS